MIRYVEEAHTHTHAFIILERDTHVPYRRTNKNIVQLVVTLRATRFNEFLRTKSIRCMHDICDIRSVMFSVSISDRDLRSRCSLPEQGMYMYQVHNKHDMCAAQIPGLAREDTYIHACARATLKEKHTRCCCTKLDRLTGALPVLHSTAQQEERWTTLLKYHILLHE